LEIGFVEEAAAEKEHVLVHNLSVLEIEMNDFG
jgi:hypothetical protein